VNFQNIFKKFISFDALFLTLVLLSSVVCE